MTKILKRLPQKRSFEARPTADDSKHEYSRRVACVHISIFRSGRCMESCTSSNCNQSPSLAHYEMMQNSDALACILKNNVDSEEEQPASLIRCPDT
jgi:hypothetical protein